MNDERGSVTVLVVVAVALVALFSVGAAQLGAAARHRAKTDTAADAAALAGADQVALGASMRVACAHAAEVARDNGAALTRCAIDGDAVVVMVQMGVVSSAARATTGGGTNRP